VFFVDAAHVQHQALVGAAWLRRGHTRRLKTNAQRQRLNVLGAYASTDHTAVFVTSIATCDAALVEGLLRCLRHQHGSIPLLVVLDNARYHKTAEVLALATTLNITLFFLPPYSPNLNLIERFWKLLKHQVVRNRYYPTFAAFQAAVLAFLSDLTPYHASLTTLLTETFHLFEAPTPPVDAG